jgi:autotransporter-associated beta strand protein
MIRHFANLRSWLLCVPTLFVTASLSYGQATYNGPVNGTGTFSATTWTLANGATAPTTNGVTTQLGFDSTYTNTSGATANILINNDVTGLVLINGGTPTVQNAMQFGTATSTQSQFGYHLTGNDFTVGNGTASASFGSGNFGGTGFTVSLTQQIDNNINLNLSSFTFGTNPHSNADQVLGHTWIFNGNVTGTVGNWVKGGSGFLILNGNNSFSGQMNIQAGTVTAGNANALGANPQLIFSNASTTVPATLTAAAGLTISKNVSLQAAGISNLGGTDAFTIDGTVSSNVTNAARTLRISGAGAKTITGAISGTNGTANAITLQVSDGSTVNLNSATVALRSMQLGAGATINLGASTVATIDGDQAGGGITGFFGTSAGTRTINGGTIAVDFEDIGANAGGNLVFNSRLTGQADLNPGGGAVNSTVTLTNNQNTLTRIAVRSGNLSVSQLGNNTDTMGQLGAITQLEFSANNNVRTQLIYTGSGETSNRDIRLFSALSNTAPSTVSGTAAGFSLVNNGTGVLNLTGNVNTGFWSNTNPLVVNSTGAITGTLNFGMDGTGTTTLSGVISNGNATAVSVTKLGTGTWTLSGANTYTGATTVSAGTLIVNGNQSAATGAVTVATGATLGGSGTIGGATTISGIHSPGNSPGIQTFSNNLTYNAGAAITWELNGNSVSNSPTMIFDRVNVGGTLNFAGATTLNINELAGVSLADPFWMTERVGTNGWLIFDATTITNFNNLTLGTGSSNSVGFYSLFLDTANNDIYLNLTFTPVPEPSSLLLVTSLSAGLLAGYRRRRSRNQPQEGIQI